MQINQVKPAAGLMLLTKEKLSNNQTISGIYIPEEARDGNETFKVLAIGAIIDTQPTAEVGNTVIIREYGGSKFKLGENEYLFIKFDEVLATVEED